MSGSRKKGRGGGESVEVVILKDPLRKPTGTNDGAKSSGKE